MKSRPQSEGKCAYCGQVFSRGRIGRHLATCKQRQEVIDAANRKPGKEAKLFHLRVEDLSKLYWLDLEVNGSATLEDLDGYLRAIWLECCGHMSQFTMGGWRGEEIALGTKIQSIFRPDVQLTHLYDFGTTSETLVKAVSSRTGVPTTTRPIALMARNNAPAIPCMECDKEAVFLCQECMIEDTLSGSLCAAHAEEHPHEEYGELLDIVNSPRMGMCGYTGPADPPY